MKLGPVTKTDTRNTATTKKIDDDIMLAICDVNVFIPIYGYMQPSGSRILNAWSIKLRFSLAITFYLTKTENS